METGNQHSDNKWEIIDNARISYHEFQYWVQQRRMNQQKDVKKDDMIRATGLGNALSSNIQNWYKWDKAAFIQAGKVTAQCFSSRMGDTDGRFHSTGKEGRLHLRHVTSGKSSRYRLPLLVRSLGEIKQGQEGLVSFYSTDTVFDKCFFYASFSLLF